MINLNYYLFLYIILAIFTNSADVIAEFDSHTGFIVTGIDFINFNHANHPMEFCKSKMSNDAIWIGYYDNIIPSDICNRHISCRDNDVPDREFIGVYPKNGVRCQRRTQNEGFNFGYGCYEGVCVPITCMDDDCWRSHAENQEKHDGHIPAQNVFGTDHSGQRHSRRTQQNQYSFPSRSPYWSLTTASPSPQHPNSNPYAIDPDEKGTIIRFRET